MQGDGVGEVEPRACSFAVSQSKNISMDKNKYPEGWNQKRVQEVIDQIESRTEEETIAEDDTALFSPLGVREVKNEQMYALS